MSGRGERFLVLDGVRGIAAFAVFLGHAHLVDGQSSFYLAVDLFFMLSGFVIAHAYERRLNDGLRLTTFATIRLIRLYPAYAVGTVLGIAYAVTWLLLGRLPESLSAAEVGSAVFMLPLVGGALLYPLNGPAWSLFFELVANFVFASSRLLRSTPALVSTAVIAGIAVGALSIYHGSANLGWSWESVSLLGGLSRVAFGFAVGVLAYRFRAAAPVRAVRLGLPITLVCIWAALVVPLPSGWTPIAGPALILFALPLLLVSAVNAKTPTGWAGGLLAWMGAISYPLYAIHEPLLRFSAAFAVELARLRSRSSRPAPL